VNASPGDPNRISDLAPLLQRAGPGGDLTLSGVEKLNQVMTQNRKSVDGVGLNQILAGAVANAKKSLSFEEQFPTGGGIRDPEGEKIFNTTFQNIFWSQYDSWVEKGNDPHQFPLLDPKKMEELTDKLRPRSQMNADRIAAVGELTGTPALEPPPPPPKGVDAAAWGAVMADRPMSGGAPYPAASWASAIEMLRKDPTAENIKLFDSSKFGRAGFRGQEILDKLGGKTETAGPAAPVQPTGLEAQPQPVYPNGPPHEMLSTVGRATENVMNPKWPWER
jgi:hypothetical protein